MIADRNMLRAMELGWTPETGVNYYDFLAQRGEGPAPTTGDPRLNSSTGGIQNLLQGLFSGAPSQGGGDQGFRFNQGTTTFTGYDPETDSFTGTIGGIAGSSPFSIPRSMATPELMQAYEQYQARANNSLPGMDVRSPQAGMPMPRPPMADESNYGRLDPTRSLYPGMGAGSGGVRSMEFIDVNRNGIDDRDEIPGSNIPRPGDVYGFNPVRPISDPKIPQDRIVPELAPPGVEVRQEEPPMEMVSEGGMGAETVADPASSMLDQPPASDYTYVPSITRSDSRMDPITQQLLFGLDGEGGFIPGAMRAAERTFFDEQGRARVIPQEIAGFSPDQQRAFELARSIPGRQAPFIGAAMEQYRRGIGGLEGSQAQQLAAQQRALEAVQSGAATEQQLREAGLEDLLGASAEARQRALQGETRYLEDLIGVEGIQRRAADEFGTGLGEAGGMIRGAYGAFDPTTGIQPYMDPFEQMVVQQTMSDIMEAGAQRDISARAGDIARGGESAFGSRARLGAAERERALGRGLGEAIGALRSRGFEGARGASMGEFARQQAGQRAAASQLAGLAGQQLGAQTGLAAQLGQGAAQRYGTTTGTGQTLLGLGQIGQQAQAGAGQAALGTAGMLAGAQQGLGGVYGQQGLTQQQARAGYGSALSGLGTQSQGAALAGINALSSAGALQQQQQQSILDAQRQAALQAQAAPLAQYQALSPFMNMVPRGTTSFNTQFGVPPNPLQQGIGTGLATLGALGQLYGGLSGNQQRAI